MTPEESAKPKESKHKTIYDELRQDVERGREEIEMESGIKQSLAERLAKWQEHTGQKVPIEKRHNYEIIDTTQLEPKEALELLKSLIDSQPVVFHGMHNNEFRRAAGMPNVEPWRSLDPNRSHQAEGRKAVYATTSLEGGIVHATLEHKFEDQNPIDGETYSIPLHLPDGKVAEVSTSIKEKIASGQEVFTDGLLYILPARPFEGSGTSNHEVISRQEVRPVAVIRLSKSLGRIIITPETIVLRQPELHSGKGSETAEDIQAK